MISSIENNESKLKGFEKGLQGQLIALDPLINELNSIWEVRIYNSLENKIISNSNEADDFVMLRNVMTGLYLCYKPQTGLEMSPYKFSSKIPEEFLFFLQMKNSLTSDNSIK